MLLCLSLNIYHEARSESERGQLAVATVTMNRYKDKEYPNHICGVVYEPGAFSWTFKNKRVTDKDAYKKARKLARLVLTERYNNPVGRRKYFNTISLGKRYKTPYKPIKIDNMIYY